MPFNQPLPGAAPGKLSVMAISLATVPADPAGDDALRRPVAAGFALAKRCDQGRWSFEFDSAAAIPQTATRLLIEIDKRIGEADVLVTYGSPLSSAAAPLAGIRERCLKLPHLASACAGDSRTRDVDLATMLFPRAASAPPLADTLREAGVPMLSGDADVASLWREDRIAGLREAVLGEAVGTLMLLWLINAFADQDEALATRPLAALARHVEAAKEGAHLRPMLTSDLIRWARARAMRADVADALRRIEARIASAEAERPFTPPG